MITLALPLVIAYAAADGTELWRAECLNGEITPSPVFAGGLLFVASPSEKLMAIRPDGQGDVTKTHVVWAYEDNVPDVTSPLSNGELVFTVTTSGMLTCLDAKDGKKQWDHDFEMECHASPSLAGDRLYLLGQKGTAVVVEAARQFKELFRTEMGDALPRQPGVRAGPDLPARGDQCVVLRGVRSPKSEVRSPGPVMSVDLKYVDEAVARIGRAPDAVIPILQALQDHYGYLPEEALRRVCAATQITPAAISGVSTFYDMFRHEPSGKHIVHVCHGTACHVAGRSGSRTRCAATCAFPRARTPMPSGNSRSSGSPASAAARSPRWCGSRARRSATRRPRRCRAQSAISWRASRMQVARQTRRPALPHHANGGRRDQGLPRLVLRGEGNGPGISCLAAEPGAERRQRHGETRRLRRGVLSDADGRGRRAGQVECDLRRA